jgi:hypothetical protein
MPNWTRRQWSVIAAVAAVFVVVIVGAVLAGGDAGTQEAATADTSSSTATTEPTTTTTTASVQTYPLTGMPVDDVERAQRPALVVKIDNAEPRSGQGGRPQAGINQADVVYEEVVEGSVTRFASVFHSTDADPVGPVRSARTTDLLLMAPLHRPLFAWSGANANVAGQVREADLVDVGHDASSSVYYRDRSRPAPYNLFASTPGLRASVPDDDRPPPQLFTYRPADEPATAGRPVVGVHVVYGDGPGSAPVDYDWDGSGWARSQRGDPHVDADGVRVAPPNVIVRFTPYEEVQCCDAAGFPILEAQLVGEGEAWVLTDGRLVEGRWSRPTLGDVTSYTDTDGNPIGLTPGPTWLAIAPPGSTTVR